MGQQRPYSQTGMKGTKASRASMRSGADIVGGDYTDEGPGPDVMTAATLAGDEVVNRAGESLGEISDIMVDVRSGCVAYAVMSVDGFLGMGEKLFAIPWHALTLDADRHCFVLDVARDRLEEAPGFDKDHWPSMADEQWAMDVHSFYGQTPYWSRTM